MAYDVPPPEQCPEPGYYYHYKHDPNGPLNNYAYYIYGVGHHTEDDCRPEDAFMQVYRPLYETAYAYRNGGMFDLRPLYMFHKPAIVNGVEVPRFTKITDPESGWPLTPSERDRSEGPTASRSTPSTAAISAICSTASMSSIMQASSTSLFDCAMCSKSGVLPKLAARLPAAMPRSPSGG